MRHLVKTPTRPAFRLTAVLIEEAARLQGIADPSRFIRRGRERQLSHARFGVIWVLRQIGVSYPEIARQLRFDDHKSVMHGFQVAVAKRAEDVDFYFYTENLLRFATTQYPQVEAKAA